MKGWARRIRGAIGMGLTWGLAWFAAGMVLLMIVGFGAADVPFPLFFGLLGFLAGATFSGIVGIVERRRSFDEMSLPRFAGWGAAGGIVFTGIFASVMALQGDAVLPILWLAPLFAVAGAGCATGSLLLARRVEDQASLTAGPDLSEAALTEAEELE